MNKNSRQPKNFCGVTSQGRITREAPAQAELRPPAPRFPVWSMALTGSILLLGMQVWAGQAAALSRHGPASWFQALNAEGRGEATAPMASSSTDDEVEADFSFQRGTRSVEGD
jgi:hypothetical protein